MKSGSFKEYLKGMGTMLSVFRKYILGFVGIGLAGGGLAALALGAQGCELILGIEEIEYADSGALPSECWNKAGANGKGCFRSDLSQCPLEGPTSAETHFRVTNACTPSQCFAFTSELTNLLEDGGLPSVPELPSKVSIRLTVTPSDADLILDGMRVGSAGDALVLPRSTQSRPLRVEKQGFEAQAIWILPDRDQDLPPIALRPAPAMVPVPTAVPARTPVKAAPHGDIEKPDYLKK